MSILNHLKEIDKPIIFQVTLTPYKNDIESNTIDKNKIIEAIKELSSKIGKDNLDVRYNPIFISKNIKIWLLAKKSNVTVFK